MNNAIDFSFYPDEEEQEEEEEKQQREQEQEQERKAKQQEEQEEAEELANADLLRQFRQLFAPIVNDSLQLYYQLNESDTDVQHIRIHRTVAELNELTSSEEETLISQLNSPSPLPQLVETPTPLPLQEETPSVSSMMSSTSSSCLYAIHTPSPAQRLESPQSEVSEAPLTITEQVQLHAPPSSHADNNNIINDGLDDDPNSSSHNNNNTSCSISSTLTDSKTLDGRTPIVV